MNGPDTELPLEQLEEIDRLADQFEREFRAGENPQIEHYLQRQPDLRADLFRQLLDLEIELRQAAGDPLVIEQYHQRFPEDRDMISAVMRAVLASTMDCQPSVAQEEDEPQPEQLGRYEIRRRLGRGGFGVVYLAHDPQLDRAVALKVPRRKRFQTAEQVASFIEEARTAAKLKHALLIAVYDVQQHNGLPYIVQEYIDGPNLGEWAATHQPSFEQIARVFVGVAEALAYVHQQGLMHCDLKLANVLMDSTGQPHVADFGLAIHESAQALRRGEVFGTPATMAPEQVRGESHRLDGRTDIWAIGGMLYELLVGRKPFMADSRKELFAEIRAHDPKPPRQIDRSVPRELERICLKCLSKRRSDRYNTADDLREDLLTWFGEEPSTEVPQSTTAVRAPDSSSGSKPPVKIIPKGLRAFDAKDADFFLELLPGPRDRDGLPESIRFWKHRIEESDADETFSVGLVYGPSGCGKSSLVKAGLLPRLSEQVLSIYVEATAADTEVRILKQMRKHVPELPADCSLADACAELRLTGAGRGRKLLLVVDQFEQWLHAHPELRNCQLVDALRQCEGGRLQAVLLVRDDFFASVHRLFQELEAPLVEARNYALVDRFDKGHARKVLMAFGRAFGKLADDVSPEHEAFIDQAINDLAEGNKVISVRLALFADMLKTRPWVPTSLREVGGVGGVGVTFLEETFSAKTAPPPHRVHQQALRSVLQALLPEAGTDIKGSMQSGNQLREASGYEDNGPQFEELIHILDSELRLITPTDPDGSQTDSETDPNSNYYQLTHDYLVPSLREWLTRKQKETRRGRAELRLAERSAAWNAKPDNRHLPNVFEWLNIRFFTDARAWSDPQRKLMHNAARFQVTYWGTILVVLLVIGMLVRQYAVRLQRQTAARETTAAVNAVQAVSGQAVTFALKELDALPRGFVARELRQRFGEAEGQQKLSLAYALARVGHVEVDAIVAGLVDADTRPSEVSNVVTALSPTKERALPELRSAAAAASGEQNWPVKTRLAIVAMYLGDTSIAAEMLRGTSNLPQPEEREHPPERSRSYPTQPWDPVQRTVFIAQFPQWCGEIERLAGILQTTNNADFRSGISLALGGIEHPGRHAKETWQQVLAGWYAEEVDAGTHSAAGWAMRRWNFELPPVELTAQPLDQRDWWHTPLDLTMLRIPAGQVASENRPIVVDEPFWLSDREISIAQFKKFMAEAEAAGRPEDWRGADTFDDQIDDNHPVQQVSWEDAILFCNWLSGRHNVDDVYKIEPLENSREKRDVFRQKYTLTVVEGADGFRLPTADEWELACRAGTTTDFACGDDEKQLPAYAVFFEKKTEPCGSLRCNAWGLFDMHGNVWEWCWNSSAGSGRVICGGSWYSYANNCRSSDRSNRRNPPYRDYYLGFRVARGPLAGQLRSGAESGGR